MVGAGNPLYKHSHFPPVDPIVNDLVDDPEHDLEVNVDLNVEIIYHNVTLNLKTYVVICSWYDNFTTSSLKKNMKTVTVEVLYFSEKIFARLNPF